MSAVKVVNLVKDYKKVRALNGISFDVKEGEIFGLIGPNGAGKTTTLRIIATLLTPTSGTVLVMGHDVVKEPQVVRGLISYLPEEAGAYDRLSGYEYLEMMAYLAAKNSEEAEEMLERGIKLSGLGERLKDRIKTYSKGMKRRLLLARALMTSPKVAILDEPTSGLDVIYAVRVRESIRRFVKSEGATVILSSHNMLEVEHLCDRVAIIHRGNILAIGNPKELMEEHGVENLESLFTKLVGGDGK